MRQNKIVVGVDNFGASRQAVEWAASECRLRDAELVMAHALDSADARLAAAASIGSARSAERVAQLLVAEQFADASSRHPDLTVRRIFSHSTPAEALIDASNDADLLVLGANGIAGVGQSIDAGLGHRVAVRAHCPVVVVPPVRLHALPAADHLIVVGMARGPAGRQAMRWGMEEACRRGCRLVGVIAGGRFASSAVDALVAEVGRRAPGLRFQAQASNAAPVEAILRAGRHANLIVVGSHHSEDPLPARLGSVPSAVLGRATCPVVLTGQVTLG